jgi:hypothetical protein
MNIAKWLVLILVFWMLKHNEAQSFVIKLPKKCCAPYSTGFVGIFDETQEKRIRNNKNRLISFGDLRAKANVELILHNLLPLKQEFSGMVSGAHFFVFQNGGRVWGYGRQIPVNFGFPDFVTNFSYPSARISGIDDLILNKKLVVSFLNSLNLPNCQDWPVTGNVSGVVSAPRSDRHIYAGLRGLCAVGCGFSGGGGGFSAFSGGFSSALSFPPQANSENSQRGGKQVNWLTYQQPKPPADSTEVVILGAIACGLVGFAVLCLFWGWRLSSGYGVRCYLGYGLLGLGVFSFFAVYAGRCDWLISCTGV